MSGFESKSSKDMQEASKDLLSFFHKYFGLGGGAEGRGFLVGSWEEVLAGPGVLALPCIAKPIVFDFVDGHFSFFPFF